MLLKVVHIPPHARTVPGTLRFIINAETAFLPSLSPEHPRSIVRLKCATYWSLPCFVLERRRLECRTTPYAVAYCMCIILKFFARRGRGEQIRLRNPACRRPG